MHTGRFFSRVRVIRHRLFAALLVMLVLMGCFGSITMAGHSAFAGRTLKVGYMNHPGFIEDDGDGHIVGYGAEFMTDIANSLGCKVQYVYASWTEQLNMLENGALDIVPMAQYSEERAERFLYTRQPAGVIQAVLLTMPDSNADMTDIATFCNDKCIGIQRGSQNAVFLEQYASQLGFTYHIKEYDYQVQLEEALRRGDVDLIACEQMLDTIGFDVVSRYGSDPYYLITAKHNEALMRELDYAISMIYAYEPTYQADLYRKYYSEGVVGNRPFFNDAELDYIRAAGEIPACFISDSKPAAYYNSDGELVGILPETMELLSDLCGLNFTYDFVPQDMTPLQYLREHPDHIASGVLANNPAFHGTDEIIRSNVFYTSYSVLAARKGTDLDALLNGTSVIGTCASFQAMQLHLNINYPNVAVATYLTSEDGLEALQTGEIDAFTYTDNVIKPLLSNPRYGDLVVIDDSFMDNHRCIAAINTEENALLIGIIDKCLSFIPTQQMAKIETNYLLENTYTYDKNDVFLRYRIVILIGVLVFVSIIAAFAIALFLRQRKHNRDITLHAEYDFATGLLNRKTMERRAHALISQNSGRGYAFLLLNVDDLRRINDLHGMHTGDEVIRGVANVLRTQFRGSELVGRMGGDEFAVLLMDIQSKSVLVPLLARLHNAIAAQSLPGKQAAIRCSIGVTMGMTGKGATSDEAYRRANEALRYIKSNGKNGFAFYEANKSQMNAVNLQRPSEDAPALAPEIQADAAQSYALKDALLPEAYSEDSFRGLIESMTTIGIYVIEQKTRRVLYYNRRFKGICPNIRIGMCCRNLRFGPCQNCIVDTMGQQQMAHTIFHSERQGDEIEITASKLLWGGKIPAVMITTWPRNLLTSSSDKLPGVSNIDSFDYVSGGLTRTGFIRMMERMRDGGVDLTEYAVLFLNIKDFKAVNEMVNSDGGDNLLRTVFARVEQSKLHPVIGARKESDHFVFLVEKNAIDLGALPELLSFHWNYAGKDLFIHCRMGVFPIEDGSLAIYKMIDRAKLAKEHIEDDYVKPYAVYDASMLQEYSERAEAFLLFDKGIKNNEFIVYYQPVVDAKTGRVVSAEALVRRRTPDGKIISPGHFIPILERTGYISMLDQYVANETLGFMYRRKYAGLPVIPISFNLSQKDFFDEDFMDWLLTSVADSNLPFGSILLEITESAYTLNEQRHMDYMRKLRDNGAKILLDDFGTGYSSFGMFKNYNFDRVKLDMSFVRQLSGGENVRKVVRAIIAMCHDLGVSVVAEGVETEEERNILRDMDCDLIQGYYFSKPLDEASFVAYVKQHL